MKFKLNKKYHLKFKLNAKVKNCTEADCIPDECDKDYEWWWAKETDIELVRSLMKVE